ncbi:MAG: sugar phosphate isomerase/epimerase [Oscillospiraceae bacterium]|nr:sugar phosphate isomerase/epimerase [Oscillospiraceae bacterium]
MKNISQRLYISTIAEDAAEKAREFSLGLEITEFCTAYNMDTCFDEFDAKARNKMQNVKRLTFHAPFNELSPAAIDPLILDVAKKRLHQAWNIMQEYHIDTMIAHSGFLPHVYYEEWFVEKSVDFWLGFLSDKPKNFKLHLENVLESTPAMLIKIVQAVGDARLTLCFDIAHAALMGPDIPVVTWAEQMAPHLGHIHLHNNHGQFDTHNALGDGIIDINAVLQKTAVLPDITFTIETINANESLKWLEANGFLG